MQIYELDMFPVTFCFTDCKFEYEYYTNDKVLDTTGGQCGYSENQALIIIGVFNNKISTLVHEIHHAVNYFCKYIGVSISIENDEYTAYISQNLVKKILLTETFELA